MQLEASSMSSRRAPGTDIPFLPAAACVPFCYLSSAEEVSEPTFLPQASTAGSGKGFLQALGNYPSPTRTAGCFLCR